jgi:hypothetical protein
MVMPTLSAPAHAVNVRSAITMNSLTLLGLFFKPTGLVLKSMSLGRLA